MNTAQDTSISSSAITSLILQDYLQYFHVSTSLHYENASFAGSCFVEWKIRPPHRQYELDWWRENEEDTKFEFLDPVKHLTPFMKVPHLGDDIEQYSACQHFWKLQTRDTKKGYCQILWQSANSAKEEAGDSTIICWGTTETGLSPTRTLEEVLWCSACVKYLKWKPNSKKEKPVLEVARMKSSSFLASVCSTY